MIGPFTGYYRFLSNFYPCVVFHDNTFYCSAEHAYQAAKTLDIEEKLKIRRCVTASVAKKVARTINLRPDWEQVKFEIMKEIVTDKFQRNDFLKNMLLKTGDLPIAEVNNWGDTYWGVFGGVGSNHLGKILMEIRSQYQIGVM